MEIIENTSVKPFNKICHLNIKRNRKVIPDKYFDSTGFFIDKNFILTAAHNIHSNLGTKVIEINVHIGQYRNEQLFDSIPIKGYNLCQRLCKTPEQFSFIQILRRHRWSKRIPWDYGLIYIPNEYLPEQFTWENEFIISNQPINTENNYNVSGYPGNEPHNNQVLIHQTGNIRSRNSKSYWHSFDTHKGNSGSPLWTETTNGNFVSGIHTYSGSGTLLDEFAREWVTDTMRILKNDYNE